jgi:hypothetical protein
MLSSSRYIRPGIANVKPASRLRNRGNPRMLSHMKISAAFALGILCMTAACQSPGGLADRPPTWTAAYGAPWDALTNCIAEQERSPLVTVTPRFFAQERRATISVTTPTGSAVGVYDIQAVSGGGTQVSYRSIFGGPTSDAGGGAYEKARRCGNSA